MPLAVSTVAVSLEPALIPRALEEAQPTFELDPNFHRESSLPEVAEVEALGLGRAEAQEVVWWPLTVAQPRASAALVARRWRED
jgi:hypothetical protein